MTERRLRLDLTACALLVCNLLVALAVVGHALPEPQKDFIGPVGAWLAEWLHESLGIAVYFFLAGWLALCMLFFTRRNMVAWSLRFVGWVLLLPCSAVAAHALRATLPGPTLFGAGGSIGAWLTWQLETRLTPTSRMLTIAGCSVLGLALAFDFVAVRFLKTMWKLSQVMIRCGPRAGGRLLVRMWSSLRRPVRESFKNVEPRRPRPNRGPLPPPHIRIDQLSTGSADRPKAQPREDRTIPIHHHDQTPPTLASNLVQSMAALARAVVGQKKSSSEEDRFADFELPPLSMLDDSQPFPYQDHDNLLLQRAALLEKTFADFSLNVKVVKINTGPVITQYEIALDTGLRLQKVTSLADDLAINLKVPSVRIVAPIPGKNTVGIEIPNEHRAVVRLKEVILASGERIAKSKLPLFLGKDTEGHPLVYDLAEMPHLLIAGRTGTGKSVCMNAIILSILMTRRPDEVKMIMIDPKMLELSEYGKIPHLMHPVVKDMRKAEAILSWAVDKMEERYDLLSRARVRSIAGYNELSHDEILRRVQPADDEERLRIPERMPYIIIFVDEMNDLMMTMRKEVEGHIIRLAQKSRAAGIHLVVATQKPTVDVITGLIKSNLPARICFQVSSRVDSRVVLDEMGADKLLGKGDMLFLQPGTSTLMRAQGTYASDEEISKVVGHLECDPCYAQELVQLKSSREGQGSMMETLRARDELYESAIEIVIREGRGSVSLLQRALGIGYGRAARLIDFMAEDGIVGAYNGSSAREVIYTPEQWELVKQGGQPAEAKPATSVYNPSAN